jgi:hypothetical protein
MSFTWIIFKAGMATFKLASPLILENEGEESP